MTKLQLNKTGNLNHLLTTEGLEEDLATKAFAFPADISKNAITISEVNGSRAPNYSPKGMPVNASRTQRKTCLFRFTSNT